MAKDQTQNCLSPSLRPRTDVTSRPTGGALGPADDVASTQAGISLEHRAVIDRTCGWPPGRARQSSPGALRPQHSPNSSRRDATNVISPPEFHNGNGRVRATVVENVRHPGRVTRVAYWVVDVAIPKLIPDRVTARFRQRLRRVDEPLERTAHRLTRQRFAAARTRPDRDAR